MQYHINQALLRVTLFLLARIQFKSARNRELLQLRRETIHRLLHCR